MCPSFPYGKSRAMKIVNRDSSIKTRISNGVLRISPRSNWDEGTEYLLEAPSQPSPGRTKGDSCPRRPVLVVGAREYANCCIFVISRVVILNFYPTPNTSRRSIIQFKTKITIVSVRRNRKFALRTELN